MIKPLIRSGFQNIESKEKRSPRVNWIFGIYIKTIIQLNSKSTFGSITLTQFTPTLIK